MTAEAFEAVRSSPTIMATSKPVELRHFDVILSKSTANLGLLAAAMFVGDRTTASSHDPRRSWSSSMAGAAAVVRSSEQNTD